MQMKREMSTEENRAADLLREGERISDLLREGERIDDLQRGGYRIIQHPGRFCFGIDAVLLSDFADAHASERVLDLCTGSGVIPTLMLAKTKCRHFTGLELHGETAEMAQRSVRLNGIEKELCILQGDLRSIRELLKGGSFDVVTCNPPYMSVGHGLTGKRSRKESADCDGPGMQRTGTDLSVGKDGMEGQQGERSDARQLPSYDPLTMARHEVCATLEDVVDAAASALREQGRLYLVHRPFRLAEIIRVLGQYRLEPKRMRLVYPMIDREPNMVLIEARKGAAPQVNVEPPLIVYEKPGVYTGEIHRIYFGE